MDSIDAFWASFKEINPAYKDTPTPVSYYYGDNQQVADDCARLVQEKTKQATSPSLWWFTKHQEALPAPGDLAIITNWHGEPKAIVKTTKIEIVKFKDISPEYAFIEGEGDRSLDYWKAEHWKYYNNEMQAFGETPSLEMEIVCEYFETIG